MSKTSLEMRILKFLPIHDDPDTGLLLDQQQVAVFMPQIERAIADWIKEEETVYRDHDLTDEADALYNLRASLLGEVEPKPVVWVFRHSGMRKPSGVPGCWASEQEARNALLRYF